MPNMDGTNSNKFTLTKNMTTPNSVITLNTFGKRLEKDIEVNYTCNTQNSYSVYPTVSEPSLNRNQYSYNSSYGLGQYNLTSSVGSGTYNASSLPTGVWYNNNFNAIFSLGARNFTFGFNWESYLARYTSAQSGTTISLYNNRTVVSSEKGYTIYSGSEVCGEITKTGTVSITSTTNDESTSNYKKKSRTTYLSIGGTQQASVYRYNTGGPNSNIDFPSEASFTAASDAYYILDSSELSNDTNGVFVFESTDSGNLTLKMYFGTYNSSPSYWDINGGGAGQLDDGTCFMLYHAVNSSNWNIRSYYNDNAYTCTRWILKWPQSWGIYCPYIKRLYISF